MNIRRKKKIFLWVTGLDDFINGEGIVGGLTVQMFFWSQIFLSNGWEVKSLTTHKDKTGRTIQGVFFTWLPKPPFFAPFLEFVKLLSVTWNRPDLIITRGATRSLFCLAFFSRVFRVKLVAFMASDSDIMPGSELIKRFVDRKLFEFGLILCSYVVCQNELQSNLLRRNYGSKKKHLVIPNIWMKESDTNDQSSYSPNGILWVGNFRELKRPDWFLRLAQKKNDVSFTMIGKAFDLACYNRIKTESEKVSNLNFVGGCSFFEVQDYFKKCRVFVCTSSIEGFPNTFLQAWSNGIPVITTFDPSNIVATNKLGFYVKDEDELLQALNEFDNDSLWKEYSHRVLTYFRNNYSIEKSYNSLMRLIDYRP